MDELPPDARALLALAKDAHNPPDRMARERVRRRVAAAVAMTPVAASTLTPAHAAKSGGGIAGWFTSSKIMLASTAVALTLGGSLWGLSTQRTPPAAGRVAQPSVRAQPTLPTPAPSTTPLAESALAPVTSSPAALPARAPAPSARRARAASISSASRTPQPWSLAEETALLARASEQLSHNDIAQALLSIEEHRRRFARSQLIEEREGLRVMAHCLRNRAESRAEAKAYIARAPASVLVARLERACGL